MQRSLPAAPAALTQARNKRLTEEGELLKIDAALMTARRDVRSKDDDLQAALAGLVDVEASAALGEAVEVKGVRRRVESARSDVEAARARVTGLENRRRIKSDDVDRAKAAEREACGDWCAELRAELAKFYE